MSDSPVPETLETIAARIEALSAKMHQQFAKVDQQFVKVDERFVNVDQQLAKVDQQFTKIDQQFAETRAQLGVKIEAVDSRVRLVYDAVLALQGHAETNVADHKRFTERLDKHDVRILALESRRRAKR
jgi:DNA anti-recombination protein RmuC